MARPTKKTIDYFPHYVNHHSTIFILESKFGNDGYAFWFKTLELLGDSEGMFYDCNNIAKWEFLLAKTHVNENIANEILNILANLEAIDKELWKQNRIIWCQNLVNNVQDAFKRRTLDMPKKPLMQIETPSQDSLCIQKPPLTDVSANNNGEIKLNEIKLNEIKLNKNKLEKDLSSEPSSDVPKENTQCDDVNKKETQKKKAKQVPIFAEDTEQYNLALFMRQCILENLPNAKVPKQTPEDLRKWAYDIDLMMRIDCRSPDEIKKLIDWSHNDNFWKANILSPGKLREKWDTLVLQRQRELDKTRETAKKNIPRAFASLIELAADSKKGGVNNGT